MKQFWVETKRHSHMCAFDFQHKHFHVCLADERFFFHFSVRRYRIRSIFFFFPTDYVKLVCLLNFPFHLHSNRHNRNSIHMLKKTHIQNCLRLIWEIKNLIVSNWNVFFSLWMFFSFLFTFTHAYFPCSIWFHPFYWKRGKKKNFNG